VGKIVLFGIGRRNLPKVSDSKIDAFYAIVGRNIKNVRIGRGVSQTELAHLIGFNRSSVANLEAGRQRIALHLFFLIVEALDARPDEILPNMQLLEEINLVAIDSLDEHLIGSTSTTQDFVRGTMARMGKNLNKEESEE
jgi:transcriptional regulator with XRE-family HTH domain